MVTVVVGGQYGSEGKGKVSVFLARKQNAGVAVRVGGPNAGHTVRMPNGVQTVFRQLPSACVLPGVISCIAAGSYIDVPLFLEEVKRLHDNSEFDHTVIVDPNAVIIDEVDKGLEARIKEQVGSTGSGTGYATIKRIQRIRRDITARNCLDLAEFCDPSQTVHDFLRSVMEEQPKRRIILEGTQGFGLSMLHADCYPYTTSRDTTVQACLSDAGIPIGWVDTVAMVVRARSIRVGGNSGPMVGETNWGTVVQESGANSDLTEYTSVTKKIRRVAEFDANVVRRAISYNEPDLIFMNHLDQIDAACYNQTTLTTQAWDYIARVEREIGQRIDVVGTGPDVFVELTHAAT